MLIYGQPLSKTVESTLLKTSRGTGRAQGMLLSIDDNLMQGNALMVNNHPGYQRSLIPIPRLKNGELC